MYILREDFNVPEPHTPYLQDGAKHELGERELSTAYLSAYYGAYIGQFNKRALEYQAPPRESEYLKEYEARRQADIRAAQEIAAQEIAARKQAEAERDAYQEAMEAATEEAERSRVAAEDACAMVKEFVERPVEEPQPQPKKCAKKFDNYGKNFGAMIVTFVAALLMIAVAVLNAFVKDVAAYVNFFSNAGSKEIVKFLLNANVSGMSVSDTIITYAVPGTAILAAVLVVVCLILSLVAIASGKRVAGIGAVALVALVAWLDAGILAYFGGQVEHAEGKIIEYFNPLQNGGIAWGYYAMAALLIVETVCGFCCYKKED